MGCPPCCRVWGAATTTSHFLRGIHGTSCPPSFMVTSNPTPSKRPVSVKPHPWEMLSHVSSPCQGYNITPSELSCSGSGTCGRWRCRLWAPGWTPAVRLGAGSLLPSVFYSLGWLQYCRLGVLLQREQGGQRAVLTKPAPVLLALAVLLALWMFVQEQFNGTALWRWKRSGLRSDTCMCCIVLDFFFCVYQTP